MDRGLVSVEIEDILTRNVLGPLAVALLLECPDPMTAGLEIEAAIRAAERDNDDGEEKRKSLELALRPTRYEAQRAHRQYDAVDPENRLVAGEQQRRWNDALTKANECRSTLQNFTFTQSTTEDASAEELMRIAEDFPVVWRNETTDMRTKKMVVRTLIREIVADTDKCDGLIELTIHWRGGSHTVVRVKLVNGGQHR